MVSRKWLKISITIRPEDLQTDYESATTTDGSAAAKMAIPCFMRSEVSVAVTTYIPWLSQEMPTLPSVTKIVQVDQAVIGSMEFDQSTDVHTRV